MRLIGAAASRTSRGCLAAQVYKVILQAVAVTICRRRKPEAAHDAQHTGALTLGTLDCDIGDATIRANAAPRLAGNFFSLDLARAKQAFEAVPWVRHAVVRRVWPNQLRVQLEEHRAAAFWEGENGAEKLVNTFGEVFQANPGDVEDESLPTLQGPEGSSARLLALIGKLQGAFAPLDAQIDRLEMSGRGSLRAELDSGAEVEIGRGSDEELVARVQRFVGTVQQVIAQHQRPLVYADLRHNEGYAVRLKGISTTVISTPGRK